MHWSSSGRKTMATAVARPSDNAWLSRASSAAQSLGILQTPSARSFISRVGDKAGWCGFVRELVATQISQPQDLCHFHIVDFIGGVRGVVIVGMETREPPERRNI